MTGGLGCTPIRSFGLPKFLSEIFGRHQQPDNGGANYRWGTNLLPGKAKFIMGNIPHRQCCHDCPDGGEPP
jgi:hypothetical protein